MAKKNRWRDVRQGRIAPEIPESAPVDSRLGAPYITRVKAQIVDTFMLYMPLLYFITYVVIGQAAEFRESQWAPLLAVTLYGVISAILTSFLGQTPGHKAYKIKVVNAKGERLGFWLALWRFGLFLFSACLLFGIALPFLRREQSTLHDWILGTRVIDETTHSAGA